MCQVSLRLKEVQKGTFDFKYNKVPLFAQKPWNINTSMSAATILALVPSSRYYCDEPSHTKMYVPSFIKIERGPNGDP